MNVLEPLLERHFHLHSYACRRGKGTHAAADRLQAQMHRCRYALQCDIVKYFPSIDHEILKSMFRRLIKDRRVLELMDLVIDHSNPQEAALEWFNGDHLFSPLERRRGLPIGNLTSQWFANWYLTGLDHYITSSLGIGGYVRYCDDFILLHDDRHLLEEASHRVRRYLAGLRLRLHERKLAVVPVRSAIRFVGFHNWPTHRLIRKENVRRFRRRLLWMKKAYARSDIGWNQVRPRLASWLGHAQQADSVRLIRRLSRDWIFKRSGAVNVSCSSMRVMEPQSEELPLRHP